MCDTVVGGPPRTVPANTAAPGNPLRPHSARCSVQRYAEHPLDLLMPCSRATCRGWVGRLVVRARSTLPAGGGLASRVGWAALEGALFFPALEVAIPLCDWLFITAWSSSEEEQLQGVA
jgi:hypothetical protein